MASKPKNDAPAADITVEEVDEALVSRDETHDSIDAATGTLTAEAIARRQELAAVETPATED